MIENKKRDPDEIIPEAVNKEKGEGFYLDNF